MIKNIITFGEPLIINYFNEDTLLSTNNTFTCLGGSEINTAVSLARNHNTYLLSCFPDNLLGNQFIEILNGLNVNTSYSLLSKEHLNIGQMYVINDQVIYQRQYSSFSFLNNLSINVDNIFTNTSFQWCHLTGITPLLGSSICLR